MRVFHGMLVGLVLIASSSSARAQSIDTVRFVSADGYDRLAVRVRADFDTLPAWYFGKARRTDSHYEVDFAPDLPMTLPHGQLRQIDVMVGRRGTTGALVGTLAGGLVAVHALTSCLPYNATCMYCSGDGCALLPLVGVPFYVAAGTALGALIGWTIPHWVRVGP
jgi:hypothetical protein